MEKVNFKDIINSYKNNDYQILDNISTKGELLPYNVKYGIAHMFANEICEVTESGRRYINPLKKKMIEDLLLLQYFNIDNIEIVDINDYDVLKTNGFFEWLYSELSTYTSLDKYYINDYYIRDYKLLVETLNTVAEQLIVEHEIQYGGIVRFVKIIANDILDKVVEIYKTKDGKETIQGILKDINDNTQLLETINNLSTRIGLENVYENLTNRLKNIDKMEQKDKETNKKTKKVKEEVKKS